MANISEKLGSILDTELSKTKWKRSEILQGSGFYEMAPISILTNRILVRNSAGFQPRTLPLGVRNLFQQSTTPISIIILTFYLQFLHAIVQKLTSSIMPYVHHFLFSLFFFPFLPFYVDILVSLYLLQYWFL